MTFSQFVVFLFLLMIMLVLPILGSEYLKSESTRKSSEVYTASALEQRQEKYQKNNSGKVAGITTVKAESNDSGIVTKLDEITSSSRAMLAIGIAVLSISLLLTVSLIYDFRKS